MAKSGDQPQQTSQYVLAPEQREILNLAMPGLKSFAATTPARYQGNTIAPFDPAQVAGQNMALNAAGSQAQLAGNAADTSNFYLGGNVWDPASNPNLQKAVDASVRPITEQYQQVVRPAIRDESQAAGQQFGGSRRNIAEGTAATGYLRAVGDTSSKLVQNQYETNINAQMKALGLLPTTQTAQVTPAATTSAVGDVRQQMAQALLNRDVSNFNYDQLAPFLQSKELIALLQGIPGASVTATGNVPRANPLVSGLGGAASGAALGSMIMPGIGTGVGAGAGALMSLFG